MARTIDLGRVAGRDGIGIPNGGAIGQILVKQSEADGDAAWKTPQIYTPYTNLADNSDFTHWVAQRNMNVSHGGADVYGGDRWILTEGTVTGTGNTDGDGYSGITLNGTLVQVVPSPPAVATAFVEMDSGEATIQYDAEKGEIILISHGGVIKNVMLLEGEWTEKPEYVSKGYASELAVCKFYYLYITTLSLEGNSTSRYMPFKCLFSLRTPPSVTVGAFTTGASVQVNIVIENVGCSKDSLWLITATSASYKTVMYAKFVNLCADLGRR